MSQATLLASGVLGLATGAMFALVGLLVVRRMREAEAHAALVMFSAFWFSAAIVWALQAITNLAAVAGAADLALADALDEMTTPFYGLAAAGLLYYVLYLLTGRARLLGPILLYYLVLYALIRYQVRAAGRTGIDVQDWVVAFVYETPLQSTLYTVTIALFTLPLLAAVVMYGTLFFRVRDAGTRYRVALVALGLFVWITTEALAYATGVSNTSAGELTRRLLALASTLVIFAGFQPPRWAQRRWGAERAFNG